ncbi:LysM peptidoglycan-binding domain-containing protein [Phototrophicus methaneseepsis]|uniref:LysM peptidoglycan-binding domain-containing protein n=1 Tax=Phototrophicus methaneseepsis TaxID=2710758 RepID=A0A7S8IEM2_9CHLR|nr:LysM peptidoglycan-binding domain-containing protein [Phototrophicus methaneseepsis]QPC82722.1 LysM peptidoglycan-binding domain-containing protein [Phototrophicus methaneseepsis]
MARYKLIFAFFVLLLPVFGTVQAQDNLLENPGFERGGEYRQVSSSVEDGTIFNAAPGWNGWVALTPKTEDWMNEPPNAYPHSGSYKRSGNYAQDISRGWGTFTASIFQTVPAVAEGTTLRFSVWVYQENVAESNARTRVGIGVNTGSPVTGDITWSGWNRSVKSWQELTVEATVPAGAVTVFIYSTQTSPNNPNAVYFDDAQLIVVGEGEPNVGDGSSGGEGGENATPRPPTATPQIYAPFVNPQQGDEAGRVVHTVQSGDTLAAIAVAYGVPMSEIRELNNLNGSVLQIGQELLIREGGPTATVEPTESTESAEATEPIEPTPNQTLIAQIPTVTQDVSSEVVMDPTSTPLEIDAEAAATEEATEESTEDATEEATEESAEDATEETTEEPTEPPTITPIPATATEAPPAPVESGSSGNPVTLDAAVCVLMYEDADQNRIQGPSESLLAGGQIVLNDQAGSQVDSYTTTGADEPHCFNELESGTYTAVVSAPEGYGLTTPQSLVVNVQPGARFQISFGAAEGVTTAAVPTPDDSTTDTGTVETTPETNTAPDLTSVAGLLVLGLAGVVLVGGAVVAFVARRL